MTGPIEVDIPAAIDRSDSERAAWIDVRELDEWRAGHIEGSELHPLSAGIDSILEKYPARDTPLNISCAVGGRSMRVVQAMRGLGYTNVTNVAGGFSEWKAQGRDFVTDAGLSDVQLERYARHLPIPEVGVEGQQRLLNARVLMIGVGGLGSPAGLYLAAAGVGTIGIIDADVVDRSNLQRQILHSEASLGELKTASAARTIAALNPDVTVVEYRERLTSENAFEILDADGGWDVIVDGTDNLPTRYLVNDAAVQRGIPVVHGSIYRFEGQATVFTPFDGPCYRCLYPEPPPPELAPSCAEGGVLGVLPGIVGTIQATEAIKVILGIGQTLSGRLWMYDALAAETRTLKLARDPQCPACGDGERLTGLIDYEAFCALPSAASPVS